MLKSGKISQMRSHFRTRIETKEAKDEDQWKEFKMTAETYHVQSYNGSRSSIKDGNLSLGAVEFVWIESATLLEKMTVKLSVTFVEKFLRRETEIVIPFALEKNVDDRISKLPDDILICILSLLTIEEAARASILSYRWRYLWRFFTGSLDFVDPYKIRRLAILSDPYYKCEDNYFIRAKRRNFINLVDPILGLLQTKSLQQLRICYPVNSDYDVDSWVQFAVDKRVQRLELDFSESKTEGHELHTFSPYFKTTSSFGSLVSLRLIDVDIPEEVLHYLLCYCPLLEVLRLKGAEKLIRIRVSGPSLKLKYLELRDLPNLSNLEINAPNLVSFEFCAGELIVNFKHVPSLVEMSIEGDYCTYFVYTLHQFSSFLPQLRTLKLNLMAVSVPEDFLYSIPKFPNLKHLEMTLANGDLDCYHPCVAFLKASPLLQEFTFKLSHTVDPCAYVQNIKDHPHLNLRAVSFIGFEGREVDVEFLKDLLENAVRLEKMTIDPCKYHFVGSPGMWYYRRSEGYKCARKRAIELAEKFPHVEFVIPEIFVPLADR